MCSLKKLKKLIVRSKFLVTGLFLLITGSVFSQDQGKWNGKFSLGGSYYKGNVNKIDLRSDGTVSHTDSTFEFSTSYKTIYGRTDGDENNREFKSNVKCDWKPYSIISPFLAFGAYNNIYKGYDLKLSALSGAKIVLFKDKKYNYSISAAAIYSFENYTLPKDSTEAEKPDKEKIRVSLRPKIKQQLGENVYLEHITFYQPNIVDFSDYIIETKTSLTNKLTDVLFLDLSFEYEYVSSPPSKDIEKNDFAFIVSLIVKFN